MLAPAYVEARSQARPLPAEAGPHALGPVHLHGCRGEATSSLSSREAAACHTVNVLHLDAMSPVFFNRRSESKPLTVRVDANLDRRLQEAAAREQTAETTRGGGRRSRATVSSATWHIREGGAAAGGSRFIRRDAQGRFTSDQVDIGRSLAADKRRRQKDPHAEFTAALEVKAAKKWRRVDE